MSKKDFKIGLNPATMFITTQAEPEAPAKQGKSESMPAPKKPKADLKTETKSKRLNLLLQPSLMEDLSKIATMKKDSVNNLINTILISYRNKNKDLIDKYMKIFEE